MAAGVSAFVVRGVPTGHVEEEEGHLKNSSKNDSSSEIRTQSEALITRDFLGSSPSTRCRSTSGFIYKDTLKLQDLNFLRLKPQDEDCSGLNLQLYPSSHYHSVCTLDKVKSALDRAQKEGTHQQSFPVPETETGKERQRKFEGDCEEKKILVSPPSSSSFAGACPNCLMYVLTWKSNPVCPKCYSIVPKPREPKKPRIDLNSDAVFPLD